MWPFDIFTRARSPSIKIKIPPRPPEFDLYEKYKEETNNEQTAERNQSDSGEGIRKNG